MTSTTSPMRLVADSAPLIFLGKLDRLSLLRRLFDAEIVMPRLVRDELLPHSLPPDERRRLAAFLEGCRIVDPRETESPAAGLSQADNAILNLAREQHAEVVISDDRLLRRIAAIEGTGVIGTVGILILATRRGILTATETESLLSQLVRHHSFRISTALYDASLRAIRTGRP
ncbi:DUF3368 domain-containing protein [Candidatus Fermentibacteria bacterium]|nr:DUF3368 domain-containing protein [Candidatus Fermentibacteria bacterium]